MVEYYSQNPATAARYAEDANFRKDRLMQERERAGFRQRQAHEQAQAVDAAVRRGLGGVTAGPGGQPQQAPAQASNPYQHQVGIARGPRPQAPQPQPQPQAQPQAQPIPGQSGPAQRGANLMGELTATPGGGALAMQQHQQQRQREDELEDGAWDAYVKGDIQMASTLMQQATGQDLPPYWKTKEAWNRARAANAESRELYPTDVATRRKFIEAYMADPGKALNEFVGEAIVPKASAQQTWALRRQAWLSVYEGDERGALEYAAGRKQIPPAQMLEAAYKLAAIMLPEPIFGNPKRDTYAQDIKAKAMEIYADLRAAGGGGQQVGAPGTQGVGGQPGVDFNSMDPNTFQSGVVQPAGSTAAPQPGAPQPTQPVSVPPAAGVLPPGGATQPGPEPLPAGGPTGASGALVVPGTQPPVPPPVDQQPSSGVVQPPGTQQTQPPNPLADDPLWMQQGGQPPVEPAYRPARVAPPVEPGSVDGSASELDAIGAQGSGTNEDPLIPQVQADIDNAPSGTVMLVPNPADPGGALQKMVKP